MTDAAEHPDRREITINLDYLKQIGTRGVTRAAGFLGLALVRTGTPLPTTVTLTGTHTYSFLPDPLPEGLATELVVEFNAWLIGNAIQELDRHFSLFVDDVWRILDLTDAHNTVVQGGFEATEISQITNAAKKYELVAERLSLKDPRSDRLWSISNARNCLAHAAGRVRPRDANDDKARLKIVWLAMEARLQQGDQYTVFGDEPVQAPDPGQEANFIMVVVDREKAFEIGEGITLTPRELAELCLYYSIVIDTVMAGIGEHLAARGVPSKPAGGTAAPTA